MSASREYRYRAFTIMEMVVVIGIITLLMSFLIPALGMARTQARTVQGLANLSQIGKGISVYAVDNKNIFPLGYDSRPDNDTDWATVIDGYLTDGADTYATNSDNLDTFRCPNATYVNLGRNHYSAHPVLLPDVSPAASPVFPRYKVARIRRASEIVMIMDGAQRLPTDPAPYTTFATAWRLDAPEYVTTDPWFDKDAVDNNEPINPGPNHDRGGDANGTIRWRQNNDTAANFAFADTHAKTIRTGDLKRRNIRIDQ